jgi:hypothetical protein
MKKPILLTVTVVCAANLNAEELKLFNPGFEDGGKGWKLCKMSKVVDDNGNKVLQIDDPDSKKGSSTWSYPLKIKGGAFYKVSFKAKSREVGKRGSIAGIYTRFYTRGREDAKTKGKVFQTIPASADKWRTYTKIVKTPDNADTMKIWLHTFNASVGQVCFDDITVSQSNIAEYNKIMKKGAKMKSRSRFAYPDKKQIAEIEKLIPDTTYVPAPPVTDRKFWDKLAKLKSARVIIKNAVICNNKPVAIMTDEQFLDYSKTGSRTVCGRIRGLRTRNLHNLVLAECLENKGRFMKSIEGYIDSYLTMKTWVGPPHDRTLGNFKGQIIGIDLMAVSAANLLSSSYSLLRSKLSDSLKQRLKSEIERRIIQPYLKHFRSGSTGHGFWWLVGTNNWNAVCNCGVVYTTIIMADSKKVRTEVIACALDSLKYFFKGFNSDGYCSEGIGYWTYGYGNFLTLAEVLDQYSDGKINVFKMPKVRKVAEFVAGFELVNSIFPAYADCSMTGRAGIHARLAMARNLNIPLTSAKPDKLSGNIAQILINNSTKKKVTTGQKTSKLRSWFDVSDILVCRPKSAKNAFFASIKAGHNKEHHNHNDVGSYVILLDRFMPNCDPGNEVYTSRTFSSRRYDSRLLNSWGHPVPIVGGKLQSPGPQFHGKVLKTSFTAAKDSLSIDLKPAYELSSLVKLERDFVFNRQANTVTVADNVVFSKPETFGTAIITYGKFKIISPQEIYIYNHKTCVKVTTKTTGGEIKITSEKIKENNGRGSKPFRIGIDFIKPVTKASVEIKYEKAEMRKDFGGVYTTPNWRKLGLKPDTAKAIVIEAEKFISEKNGKVVVCKKTGASGLAFKFWKTKGHKLTWLFKTTQAGLYTMQLKYCTEVTNPGVIVSLDGKNLNTGKAYEFPSTGGWSSNSNDWKSRYPVASSKVLTFNLKPGQHKITLECAKDGGMNLDRIKIIPLKNK